MTRNSVTCHRLGRDGKFARNLPEPFRDNCWKLAGSFPESCPKIYGIARTGKKHAGNLPDDVWNCRKLAGRFLELPETFRKLARSLPETCRNLARNLQKNAQNFAGNLPETCRRISGIAGTSQKHARNLPDDLMICRKLAGNLPEDFWNCRNLPETCMKLAG